MSLFGFMKKTEEKKHPADKALISRIKSIKVLGAGCKNCHRQLENVKKALDFQKSSAFCVPNYIISQTKVTVSLKLMSSGSKFISPIPTHLSSSIQKLVREYTFNSLQL